MRILIFTPQIYLLGGAERLAVELAEELNCRDGITADVLSMAPATFAGSEVVKERLLQNGVRSVQFLDRVPRARAKGFATSVRKLRRILAEGKYDIIDTTLIGPATLACWAAWGLATRHISGIHGVYQRDRHNGLTHRFWRWSCRMCRKTRFYAISNDVAEHWIYYARVRQEQVRVIHNCINDKFFQATPARCKVADELGLGKRQRLLLFVGRLTIGKGLDTFCTF